MIEDSEKTSTTEPAAEVPIQRTPAKPRASKSLPSLDFVEGGISFHGGPQKRSGLRLALWTWLSVSIDTLVLISMSCFFMLAFSILMQSRREMSFLALYVIPNLKIYLLEYF